MTTTTPVFSLIVPTRHRPAQLRRFLDSLRQTTRQRDCVEVILVVDEDDEGSGATRAEGLTLRHVSGRPGRTMGELNRAGCAVATGEFVMLLNDDVICRTPGWDRLVLRRLRRVPDGIVLLHVDDGLFGEDLCTFPLVSRTFLDLAGGICSADYRRYCIDDHVEQVFHLLAVLGDWRTVYLSEVLFEHHNVVEAAPGPRRYAVNDAILVEDQRRFEESFAERKDLALRLKEYIAGAGCPAEQRQALGALTDVAALRDWLRQARVERQRFHEQKSLWRRLRQCLDERGLPGLAQALRRRLPLASSSRRR